jgi:RNA polymerase sporulation-specific sigma factor
MFDPSIFALLKDFFFFAGYISGSTAFPKPLNQAEEKEYLEKLKNGDADAKNVLIERNLRLVAHIAKKYSNVSIDMDDLISIGTIGLIKGINSYNFEKKTQLSTYVAKCVENEMLMFMRSNKKTKNEVSLNDPIGADKEGNSISLIDILCTDENSVMDQVQLKIQVEKLYAKISKVLTQREKTVIELRYGLYGKNCLTQRETALLLNISRSYVSRIEKKAIEKLSREFKQKYWIYGPDRIKCMLEAEKGARRNVMKRTEAAAAPTADAERWIKFVTAAQWGNCLQIQNK